MSAYRAELRANAAGELRAALASTSKSVKQSAGGRMARLAGLVICRQRPSTAKGTVFATLEDEHGFADLILHERVYAKYRDVFVENPFLIVQGRVQRDGHSAMSNLIVSHVAPLFEVDGGAGLGLADGASPEWRVTSYNFR